VSGTTATITPIRYALGSGQTISGTPVTGALGTPALTVTGGWVWVVVEEGDRALLEQLDPVTLAVHAERDLPVSDTLYPPGDARPVLTATVGGPLWVAAGEDVWALNPATGVVEIHFDAGDQISSMSTDPTGALLYTGGETLPVSGMVVTDYDAHTGRALHALDLPLAVAAGTVAATTDGVWVSYRTGMAGSAQELSSNDLSQIAPPPNPNGPFDTFYQIMGVWSGVSEGVLWLTNQVSLSCADPSAGVVRASESTTVSDPVASSGVLYALPSTGGVVSITPPAACFG
jgi:hypothetical protein